MRRITILAACAAAFSFLFVFSSSAEQGCNHGPGNACNGKAYPPEQVADPGWCESHFVTDKNGVRVHRCPAKWKNGKPPKS